MSPTIYLSGHVSVSDHKIVIGSQTTQSHIITTQSPPTLSVLDHKIVTVLPTSPGHVIIALFLPLGDNLH